MVPRPQAHPRQHGRKTALGLTVKGKQRTEVPRPFLRFRGRGTRGTRVIG